MYERMKRNSKQKALLDWDGTLRAPFTILDWYEYLDRNQWTNKSVPASILRTLYEGYLCKRFSYDAFAEVLVRVYALGVQDLNESFRAHKAKDYAKRVRRQMYGFTPKLVDYLQHDRGLHVVVVTGSPEEAVRAECRERGMIVDVVGTRVLGSRNTQRVINVATTAEKQKAVKGLAGNRSHMVGVSFGDSGSDSPLMGGRNVRVVPQIAGWAPSIYIPQDTSWRTVKRALEQLLSTTE